MMNDKKAPPIASRPRCLCCGKRLRPNYDTKEIRSDRTRRVYQLKQNWSRDLVSVDADVHGAKQDDQGRWYVERRVTERQRTWQGTFGRYADGFFCGMLCAQRWAIQVARHLRDEKRQLITYNQDSVKD